MGVTRKIIVLIESLDILKVWCLHEFWFVLSPIKY